MARVCTALADSVSQKTDCSMRVEAPKDLYSSLFGNKRTLGSPGTPFVPFVEIFEIPGVPIGRSKLNSFRKP